MACRLIRQTFRAGPAFEQAWNHSWQHSHEKMAGLGQGWSRSGSANSQHDPLRGDILLPVVINRLESKRGHSVLFGFSVWENRIDNSFFPTSGEMQTVCKSDAVIRLNFEIIRVKR